MLPSPRGRGRGWGWGVTVQDPTLPSLALPHPSPQGGGCATQTLHRHRRSNMRMALITGDFEILVPKIVDFPDVAPDDQPRRFQRLALELLARLLDVIEIEVSIAESVDEFARLVTRHMRNNIGEERIGCDVEGHA